MNMKLVVKSTLFGILGISIVLFVRNLVNLSPYVSDLGGINNFIAIFGSLYGLLLALVVFEVWNQYNLTSRAITEEASAVERLYRYSRYFRDSSFNKKFTIALVDYLNAVIEGAFRSSAVAKRDPITSQKFRDISKVIENVKFNDNHDEVVFGAMIEGYSILAEHRNQRIAYAITRLPVTLKVLILTASTISLFMITVMPFTFVFFHLIVTFFTYFIISMLVFLIFDLDNPFRGTWQLSTIDYQRVKDNILKNY